MSLPTDIAVRAPKRASNAINQDDAIEQVIEQRKRLGNVGPWHESWQRCFPDDCLEKPIGECRTDVLIVDLAVEVQHSRIRPAKVQARNANYENHDKTVLWIVDGKSCGADAISRSGEGGVEEWIVVLQAPNFIKSFEQCRIVLLDIDDMVYAVKPNGFDTGTACVTMRWTKDEVVEILKSYERHNEVLHPPFPLHQSTIRVWQYPPGSGKTYGAVCGTLTGSEGFEPYDVVLMLTKPHSAKDVNNHQFEQQLKKRQVALLDQGKVNKAYWYKIQVNGRTRLVIMATVDSFIYKLGEPDTAVMDRFLAICSTIATHGPTTGKSGRIDFKGHSMQLNGQCLIIVDEATKLSQSYVAALGRLTFVCHADALVIGDKMQSIEFLDNLLTELLDGHHPDFMNVVIDRMGGEIRRFGQTLVDFLNDIVPWRKYNLEPPVASNDPALNREHDGEYKVDALSTDKENEENVSKIMLQFEADVDKMLLLPHDCLVVSPFVSTNTLLDQVRDEMHVLWRKKLDDHDFRAQLRSSMNPERRARVDEYLQWYDDDYMKQTHRPLLATRHYSEAGQPVNTSTSKMCTRMVSIHAAQGDGRRYCMTVGLSEARLQTYSREINLRYDSLLCVALSRAETKLVVYTDASYDNVWERMIKFMDKNTKGAVVPTFCVKRAVQLERYAKTMMLDPELNQRIHKYVLPVVAKTSATQRPLLDYVHHMIRACTFNIVFFLRAIEKTDAQCRQLFAKAGHISRASIETCVTPAGYYQRLQRRSDELKQLAEVTRIPLLKYQDNACLFEKIKLAADTAKTFLNDWYDKKPRWDELENNVLAMVMMWYMMDYEQNGKHLGTKMVEIYNVAKAIEMRHDDCDFGSFYETVKDAKSCFDRLHSTIGSGGNWLVMHNVTHGRRDGRKLPFSPRIQVPFVVECEDKVYTIFLRPQVNALNIAEVACTALFTRRVFEQPCTENNKNDRFLDKCVKTVFVDTCSGRDYMIPNDYVDRDSGSIIDGLIINAIRAHCEVHHQAIDKFCEFYKYDEYDIRHAYDQRSCKTSEADYVSRTICTTLECDTVLPLLDENLSKELTNYQKWASK